MQSSEELAQSNQKRLEVIMAAYHNSPDAALIGLSDEDPRVRASSLTTLNKLGKLTDTTLSEMLADPSSLVRRRGCEISAQYRKVSLVSMLADTNSYVVEMALWAEGEREEPTNIEIISKIASDHSESFVREAAIAALGAIGDERSIDVILSAMNDRPNIRRRAVVAMASYDDQRVTDALRQACRDRDWQVRQIAEDLLEITEGSNG